MKKVTLPANFSEYNFANLAKKEKNAALKVRYLALSYIESGKTVLEAAALVYKSSRMLHRWISSLTEFGLEGLQDKPGRGRKRHLAVEQEPEFRQTLVTLQQSGVKLTGRDIQKMLLDTYDIECTLPTVYNILNRMGLVITQAAATSSRKSRTTATSRSNTTATNSPLLRSAA